MIYSINYLKNSNLKSVKIDVSRYQRLYYVPSVCYHHAQTLLFHGRDSSNPYMMAYDEGHVDSARLKFMKRHDDWLRDLTMEGIEPNPGPRRTVTTRRPRGNLRRRRQRDNRQNSTDYNRVDPNKIQMGDIMPPRKIATLKYADGSNVRNNPGGNFLVYSMRINDLFDPDPTLLSGSVSNFKEMMQFYSYYRVLHTDVNWTVVNLENFPLSCGIVFSQTNLTGTIGTLSDAQNAFENDFVIPIRVISEKGGVNKTQFNINRLDLSRLLGVGTQYRSESNYTGLGLATPTTPLWANFIVFAPTGASLSNGYVNSSTLYFHSEFFGRLNNRS